MPITVTCNCGMHSVFEDRCAGQQAQCRQCGTPFIIPIARFPKPSLKIFHSYQFQIASQLLLNELLRYWGYAIAQHSEILGIQHIPGLELYHAQWKSLLQAFENAKTASQTKKLILQMYELVYQIGQVCDNKEYHFQKIAGITTFEIAVQNIQHLHKMYQCNQSLEIYLQRPKRSKQKFWITLSVWTVGCASFGNWLLGWYGLLAGLGIVLLFLLMQATIKLYSRYNLIRWFQKVWWDNLMNHPHEITEEVASAWLSRLFRHPILQTYAEQLSWEIVFPAKFSGQFILDSALTADEIDKFELHVEETIAQWYQRLYQLWREVWQQSGKLQFCFVYQQHIKRITPWLHQLRSFLQDVNKIQGAETFFVARPTIIPGGSLGVFLAALQPLMKEDHFHNSSWKAAIHLFYNFQMAVRLYNQTNLTNPPSVNIFPVPEFFQALHLCIIELARHRPLLIFLERLELSDQMSLDFLSQIYTQAWPRVNWLFSYEHQRVLQNRSLHDAIARLQSNHIWKTPEIGTEMLIPSDMLLQKKVTWEALEYGVTQCITAHHIQIIGIEGPSGVGKSFLCNRFLEKIGKDQFWVNSYRYTNVHTTCPQVLGVLHNLLESILQQKKQLKPEEIRQLEELLGTLIPHATPKYFDAAKNVYSWEAIKEILVHFTQYKPMLWLIDDLMWAEPATLTFLQYLSQHISAAIMIVFTWDTHYSNPTLNEFLQNIRLEKCFSEFHLIIPDNKEIAAYIEQSFKPNLFTEGKNHLFTQSVSKVTQNNPLLLIEFFKWLIHSNYLTFFGGFWITTREANFASVTLESLLTQFPLLLSPQDRPLLLNILEIAAVYELPFHLDLLYQDPALCKQQEQVKNMIEFLSSRRLFIQSWNTSTTTWEFVHEKILQNIQGQISEKRRKQIHQIILAYLENTPYTYQRLYHAHHAEQKQMVLQLANMLGRHAQYWDDYSTAAKIFDIGIYTARVVHNISLLAEHYLGKASCHTFVSSSANRISSTLFTVVEDSERFHSIVRMINSNSDDSWNHLWSLSKQITKIPLRIMAQRALAVSLFTHDAHQAWKLLMELAKNLSLIATHPFCLQSIYAFLSGELDQLEQPALDELFIRANPEDQLQIYQSIFQALQQIPPLPEKLQCLHCFIQQITRIYSQDNLKAIYTSIVQEFQKARQPLEQALGIIHLSQSFSQHDNYTACELLQTGLQLLAVEKFPADRNMAIAQTLSQALSFLAKIPASMSENMQKQIFTMSKELNTEASDFLLLEAAIQLPLEPQQTMEIANKISNWENRKKFLQAIQQAHPQDGLDLLEDWVTKYSTEYYGVLLVQELAEKDLGRARRFLRQLPENLDTQIVTARFCGMPGHRIQQLLQLTKGKISNQVYLERITQAAMELLERQELDTEGNRYALELLPDESLYKLPFLISMVVHLHEIAPEDSTQWLERALRLVVKIVHQGQWHKYVPSWKTMSTQLQNLASHFVMTYWNRWWPILEIIPDLNIRVAWIQSLCYSLQHKSPDEFANILQRIPTELKSKIEELDDTQNLTNEAENRLDTIKLEGWVALRSIRQKSPELGQKIHQRLYHTILNIKGANYKMQAWVAALQANSGWDEMFSHWILSKIFELRYPILGPGLVSYSDLIQSIQGLGVPLRNELIAKVIDFITYRNSDNFILLDIYRSSTDRHYARYLLQLLIPFGHSCMNHFVQRLLAVVPQSLELHDCIYATQEFFTLIQDFASHNTADWIQQAINSWEAWPERSLIPELQHDAAFTQSIGLLGLCNCLDDSWLILKFARLALDKILYIGSRPRLQAEIIWQMIHLVDDILDKLGDVPDVTNRIKILRLQLASSSLTDLYLSNHDQQNVSLRKKYVASILECLSTYIYRSKMNVHDTLPILPAAQPEPIEIELAKNLNNEFQKILLIKSEPELRRIFFDMANILCQLSLETLHDLEIPWLHRMIWIASQLSTKKILSAGSDLLQCDEWQQLARFISRIAMLYPRMALFLLSSIFSTGRLGEIPSSFEDDELTYQNLSDLLPAIEDADLLAKRDYLLSKLSLTWIEYNWQDALLLVPRIQDTKQRGQTLLGLLQKAESYYTDEIVDITKIAHQLLEQIPSNECEIWHRFAVIIAPKNADLALEVLQRSGECSQQASLIQILENMSFTTALGWISKIQTPALQQEAWSILCTQLAVDSRIRTRQLEQIWQACQSIPEVAVAIAPILLRLGIREQDCLEYPKDIDDLLLMIWQICNHSSQQQALSLLTSSFPWIMKIGEDAVAMELYTTLCRAAE